MNKTGHKLLKAVLRNEVLTQTFYVYFKFQSLLKLKAIKTTLAIKRQ